MIPSSKAKKALFVLLCLLSLALLFSQKADGADHIIPHQTYLEEFFWTFGCTPTAASMVLSYWDTSHLEYGGKYIGSGRLIDYYQWAPCSGYNVPNTLRELKTALGTDYNINSCSGSGETYIWNIDDGIRHVTNTVNGYNFNSITSCSAIWPEVFGDWCWDEIKSEIDLGRPFVWGTGNLSSGHSTAAWGYTDSKYVILYNTWEYPAGRADWYYTHYLNNSSDSIERTRVNIVVPLQPDTADISLDEPIGGEKLFAGSTYRIWWYMWGTRTARVDIYYSIDAGMTWSFVGTSFPSQPDGWGNFNWTVPNTPHNWARVRIEAYDSGNNYIAGDGSFGNFQVLADSAPPTGTVKINNGVDFTNSLSATLNLTCADGADGIGCQDMRFSNDNVSWTTWQAFAATRAWTLPAGDGVKTVYVQYRDRLGNQSPSFSDTITLDTIGPPGTISIENGQACAFSRDVTLYLACTGCVEMHFYDYFTAGWTQWEPFAATKAWTLGGTADPGEKPICVEFRDLAGNATATCDNILLDSTPEPTGSVVINNQNYFTHTPAVALALTCSEVCTECSEMRFSGDNVAWTTWEPFAPAKPWTLFGPDGMKTVYTQFRTTAGYTLATLDQIFLDTVPPAGTVTINGGAPTVAGTSVNLTLTCSDASSQCAQMRFSNDNSTWSDWQAYYSSSPKAWNLTSGDGLKTVFAQFRDSAGNLATFSDTIEIQTLFATATIDTDETSGYLNSMAVDSNGHVHIAYQREYFDWDEMVDKFDLKYATNATGAWVITTVEAGGYQMVYPSIAIDSAGHVHIAYSFGDQTSGGRSNVKYTTNQTGAWVVSRVDAAEHVGRYTSLALDSNDKAHISYYDEQNANLKYATDLSGSWEMITLDSSGGAGEYVGEYSSISVDFNNRPHIAYYFRIFANAYLKYARNISGVWEIQYLTNDSSRRRFASIAVDSQDKVHIVSSYETGGLEYRNNISGQWVYQTIPTTGHVGMYPAISLDRSDKVHLAYCDATNSDLMYANNISGSWYSAPADSQGYVGVSPSIALDSNNVVHMVHYDISNGDLKYARSPDLTAPAGSILIAGGVEYTGSGAVSLILSAADPSGVAEMCLSDTPSCSSWEAYAASKPWTLPAGSGSKTVYAWFKDALGNANAVPFSDAIILDTVVPAGSVLINSGQSHTNISQVNLSLSAVDEHSGVAEMRFSNDGVSWSAWEPYSPSKTWNLGPGDGDRTVRVQFRDGAQNASGSFTDGIIVDTTPPSPPASLQALNPTLRGQIRLSWVPPSDPDFSGCRIHYGTAPGTYGNTLDVGQSTYFTLTGLVPGQTYFVALTARDLLGNESLPSGELGIPAGFFSHPDPDYDGDGSTDVAAVHLSSVQFFTDALGNMGQYGWGGNDSYPILWDFDGDGRADVSFYHIPTNQWFVRGFPGDNLGQFGWGGDQSVPAPGDYDGDGMMDRAFYHSPSNRWFIEGREPIQFGWNGSECIPLPGDYDGDGITDLVLYHIPSNQWFMYGVGELGQYGWGGADCIPVPADYDGDGAVDIAVYHVPSNQWFVRGYPGDNLGQYGWGGLQSFPIPGDFNGDGAAERAFYRPDMNWWFIEGRPDFIWGWDGGNFMPITGQTAVYNWYRFMLGKFQ